MVNIDDTTLYTVEEVLKFIEKKSVTPNDKLPVPEKMKNSSVSFDMQGVVKNGE